ncbi:hypothetical protein GE061_016954 [Apolygus lucorum]|uniref:Uncharacterized protein n=1 Tax=Apolygus lucorum TaxID=248454 RepID=A0A8S9XKB2_APOLU|nr:hypothetical protein GE061_016954 [Apolygus lucorum]
MDCEVFHIFRNNRIDFREQERLVPSNSRTVSAKTSVSQREAANSSCLSPACIHLIFGDGSKKPFVRPRKETKEERTRSGPICEK